MTVIELLQPTASNFRAEIARHQLEQRSIANMCDMLEGTLSHYLTERRKLTAEAAAVIASAINQLTEHAIFNTELIDP